MNLNWIYTAVTWIMLRWHDVFSFLEGKTFLATNWDWVLSIVFLVITVRVILFPLFVKQIKSQRAMQALSPKIKELQQKHKGDQETLRKETMELYRSEKANPLMGCLPIFLQVPVFISLFWILGRRMDPNRPRIVKERIAEEAGNPPDQGIVDQILHWSHIELYGWTLERYESAAEAKLFNAPIAAVFYEVGWFERDMTGLYGEMGTNQLNVSLVAGVLTLIMVATTFLTTRQMILKTGWATDPTQLMMQRLMVYGLPGMLLFSGAFFPVAVIVYWVINNLFSLAQQQWVLRKYPPAANATAGATAGGGKQPTGKGKGAGGDGADDAKPAVDGRQLAPKPGAKPFQAGGSTPSKTNASKTNAGKATAGKSSGKANPNRGTPGKGTSGKGATGKGGSSKSPPKQVDPANVPPKRAAPANVPPKRKGSAPGARKSSDASPAPPSETRRRKE